MTKPGGRGFLFTRVQEWGMTKDPSTGEFLLGELRRLADDVCSAEPGVRGEEHDVHAMRVASRRLRALLAASAKVVVDPRAQQVRDELRWLGSELGRSRDVEVLGRRIDEVLGAGAAGPAVTGQLETEAAEGREAAIAALDSPRWAALQQLLGEVDSFQLDPERAEEPAAKGLGEIVDRRTKRLRKARRRALDSAPDSAPDSEDTARDEALHEVRKRAKAVRYSAEVAAPVLGKRAERLAALAEEVQDVLGQHQDTVMARARLHRLVTDGDLGAEAAFALGTMAEAEEQRAEEARQAFDDLRKPPKHVRG
jgi:CHAD domain-containing protein